MWGGDGSSTIDNTTGLTIVDPYIQDAVMYHDENNNSKYDDEEQLSTLTSEYGYCSFIPALPFGAVVRMHTKGNHNGVPFTGDLTANLTGTGIVSPMTTLLEKFDDNATAVAQLLQNAGIDITEDDLTKDPMVGLKDTDSADFNQSVARIQASIAINTFLELIGTDSNKSVIQTKIDAGDLNASVNLVKNAIKVDDFNSSEAFNSVVGAAVAVANYVTTKKDSNLTAAQVEGLTSKLKKEYKNDPKKSYKLDVDKLNLDDINGTIESSLSEAKTMTASQFFNFEGNTFALEYSGGFLEKDSGYHRYDSNGSDDLNPAYFDYMEVSLNGNNIEQKYTDYSFNWLDKDKNNLYLKQTSSIKGKITGKIANSDIDADMNETRKDGTPFNGNYRLSTKTDGSTQILKDTLTSSDGNITETYTEKRVFISAEKVTKIAGVEVGDEKREVYKVKTKSQEGLLDGDKFVASGEGYNTDYANDYNGTIEEFVNGFISNKGVLSGSGNSNIVFAKDGKFIDRKLMDQNKTKILDGMYWEIKDNVLKVRANNDYDIEIKDGKLMTNWIGWIDYSFTNVTQAEASAIVKVLVPDHNNTLIFE